VPEPVIIPTGMARDATRSIDRWTVVYDADCGFCRWSLARVLALDRTRKLRPLALHTPEANELLSDLTPEQRAASWHLVAPDGCRASGGAAAAPMLRLLPGGALPAAIMERAPRLVERAYRWVADHRSLLSRPLPASATDRARAQIDAH
jgi:predicted DCC family thiol-disulfide oxidoreductase YuxK